MSTQISIFKSKEKETAYMAAYDEAMKLWPVPYETTYISTSFGETYVNISGSEDGEPVILLSGNTDCSVSWYANVEALGAHHRLYAVDVIDDVGKSKVSAIPETREEAADWLREVCEGLELEKPHLVGLSFGGLHAINFTYYYPDHVGKLVMLSPAGTIGGVSYRFLLQVIPLGIFPFRRGVAGFLKWLVVNPEVLENAHGELLILAMSVLAPIKKVAPFLFTDEELKSIKNRTLLKVGDHDVTYKNRSQAIERAKRLMPELQVEIVPDCGHFVPQEQPGFVNSRILEFLAEG